MISNSLEVQTIALQGCIKNIETAMKTFWESQLIQHYTRHGIDHSERLIEILGDLLKSEPDLLNDYEKFILISATYLHALRAS